MTTNQTFTMIKPNAVEKGHTGTKSSRVATEL